MFSVIDIPKSYYHTIVQVGTEYYLLSHDETNNVNQVHIIKCNEDLYIEPASIPIDGYMEPEDEYIIKVNGTTYIVLLDSDADHMIYRKKYLLSFL